jgi:hypothetical protein
VTLLEAGVFSNTNRYLEVQVSPDPAISTRLQFGYVPYAFQAEQAGVVSRLGFSLAAVDSAGNVGSSSSITLGADGLPVISYFDGSNSDLKVAHCGNGACTAGNTVTAVVTGVPPVGPFSSMTMGADGLPVISYQDGSDRDLKVAKCGNASCTAGNTLTVVDSVGLVGYEPSITIGADGLPVISHRDATNGDLRVAKCGNAACTAGNTLSVVDSAGSVGQNSSVTIGAEGLPVISYRDDTNDDLKVAHCGDAACSAGNTLTVVDSAGDVGYDTSIALGTDGLPVISYLDYTNRDLKVVHCGSVSCGAGNTLTVVDSAGDVGYFTSIALLPDGLPLISYYTNSGGDLKVAHCGNTSCSASNTFTTVDSGSDAGYFTSLTLGTDGRPVISYSVDYYTDGDLT